MTTVDLSEYRTPGRGRGILDVFHWRYLLQLLIRKGTQTRYRNSALGWGWSYVKPAAQFSVYYVVMGILLNLHRDIPLFAVYLFSGIVMVNFFNEAFSNATKSITDNRALVKKIYLPRELFPIAAVVGAFIHFLPQVAILLAVCLIMGWTPSILGIAAMLLAIVIVAVTALGLGMFFGALNVAYRDAQNFVEIIQVFSTWSVPVLYTWHMVADKAPEWLLNIYMVNPLATAVELFHRGVWRPIAENVELAPGKELFAAPPHLWMNAGIGLAIGIVFLIIGQLVFRRFERRFAQDL
ncbi:MAG: ABC transporter permease [Mycetocola sp.]